MGAKDVLNRFLGHVTAKRDNAASFMASLPGAPGSTMGHLGALGERVSAASGVGCA